MGGKDLACFLPGHLVFFLTGIMNHSLLPFRISLSRG
jgi:hypothetical protein